ncbi:MAG TPA: universal stress protein, partial [Polyangiaceae bacterium]|nr:universal stress protein [Polyangiaceae bacterium]
LVPTDFSVHSALALQTAADLSRRYGASLVLAYVYEPIAYALPDGYLLFSEPQLNSMFGEFEKRLSVEKQAAEAAGALRVETQLLQGVAATEIRLLAERGAYDLIVMGTHGRKGLPHVVLGSVAERVVRSAPCPVLTVRAQS